MSVYKRGDVYWYNFLFAGRHIQESSKSPSKTVAKEAEKQRRRELENGFNNLVKDGRDQRVQMITNLASEFMEGYKVRKPKSAVFAEYALRHPVRLLGDRIMAEIGEDTITSYQTVRLKEGAAPKTVNDEVVYLLRILGDRGEVLRARLRKTRSLKLTVTGSPGKAFTPEDQAALEEAALNSRSHRFRLALTLARHTGMRSKELRTLQWRRLDLEKAILTVGESKNAGSSGRTIPLNSTALPAAKAYAEWYRQRFGELRADWYVFPFGKPHPHDPARPVTTLKTAWKNAKTRAGVTGRLHDFRHTAITELAENGAGDQVIKGIVGHVSDHMIKHYSHVRTEAKREALERLANKSRK